MDARIISVLMVEDNQADVLFYKELLTNARYYHVMITDVPRAADAVRLLRSRAFDVVLLDMNLLDTRGIETVESIAPVAEANDIPVIVLSSLADKAGAMQAVLAGAADYLVKGQDDAHITSNIIQHTIDYHERIRAHHAYA